MLEPLKEATKRLEARGKAGRFGAIYEVIPVFEAVLAVYEQLLKNYDSVNYNANGAPEDHLPINLRAAWAKLDSAGVGVLRQDCQALGCEQRRVPADPQRWQESS